MANRWALISANSEAENMAVQEVVTENKVKMTKAVEVLTDELKAVRSGRASTGLVENIRVDYYGTQSPIKTIAAVTVPQHDTILIKPFDPGSVREIEKAIKRLRVENVGV